MKDRVGALAASFARCFSNLVHLHYNLVPTVVVILQNTGSFVCNAHMNDEFVAPLMTYLRRKRQITNFCFAQHYSMLGYSISLSILSRSHSHSLSLSFRVCVCAVKFYWLFFDEVCARFL